MMNYKTPIYILTVVMANIALLIMAQIGLDHDYHQYLLLVDSLSLIGLAFVIHRQCRKNMVLQSKQLLLDTAMRVGQTNEMELLQFVPDFLCLKDGEGRWLYAVPDFLARYDLQFVDFIGRTNEELALEPESKAHALKLASIQDKSTWHLGEAMKESFTELLDNEKQVVFEITRIPIFDKQFNKSKLLILGKHIDAPTEKAIAPVEQAESSNIYQRCFDSHFCLVFLDEKFQVTQVNGLFSKLCGYSNEDAKGRHISFLILGEFKPSSKELFSENTSLWSDELICRHKEGSYFPVQLSITQIKNGNQPAQYFASLFDITRQKQAENRIMKIAHYDDLTGLVNRVMFFERLNRFLMTNKSSFAVVFFIDLDRFKAVNDSLGHDAGDMVLKETATRIQAVTRKKDIVSRLSGDEFAVLMLNETSHEQAIYSASMVAEKIIQTLAAPFFFQRTEVFIGASIGISLYPEDGRTPEELLKRADVSMYEAKKQGRNNYQFYKQEFSAASQDRLEVEMNLRKAIEKKELQLYYQPQYQTVDGKLYGAEVLIRWIQGKTGKAKMVSPDKFIPIAEETGLIVDIGQWILQTACLQMKRWLDQGFLPGQLSVNVSARQFSDDNFLKSVENALSVADLESKHIKLELTESMLIGDIRQIELQLHRLKKMGIDLVLDDFGTGYSSLSYLKDFPIDVLKIDKSFVIGNALASKNGSIACAIINMGHSMGQKIVAEGVETKEQLMFLKNRGCDIIQGYYYSPPLPVEKMTALLKAETEGAGLGKKKATENIDNLFIN